jgi:hypothetical protein
VRELDKCLDWIEKAVEERDFMIAHFLSNPTHHILKDPLRSHARYKALLRKMNLEP